MAINDNMCNVNNGYMYKRGHITQALSNYCIHILGSLSLRQKKEC